MASLPKTCADCGTPLEKRNRGGLCRRHTAAHIMRSPETCAKVSRSRRLMFFLNPEKREAQAERMRRNRATPAAQAKRGRNLVAERLWEISNARMPRGSEPRMRAGAKTRAVRAVKAGVPPHMVEAYYHLTRKKRLPQAEAVALVLAEDAAAMQRWRRSVGAPA